MCMNLSMPHSVLVGAFSNGEYRESNVGELVTVCCVVCVYIINAIQLRVPGKTFREGKEVNLIKCLFNRDKWNKSFDVTG